MTTYAATIGAACLVVILTVAATRYLDDRFYVCNDGAVLTREVDVEPLSPIEAVLRGTLTVDGASSGPPGWGGGSQGVVTVHCVRGCKDNWPPMPRHKPPVPR